MEKGLVSVIMPNYNSKDYIGEAIDSVLNQTYDKLELIIIDDGSTDDSKCLINDRKDGRIRPVFLSCNGQICNALNIGLDIAKGEYIARIDSDDVWEKDKLEKQINILKRDDKIGACFTWVNIIDDESFLSNDKEQLCYRLFRHNNEDRVSHIRELFYKGCYLCHPTVLVRKKIVDQVGYYNYSFVQIQDYDYWLRLLLITDIYIINEELVRYRRCQNISRNISANTDKANVRSLNENMLMKNNFVNSLSNSQFIEIFQKDFLCKDAQTDEELKCERAFVLLNSYEKTMRYPVDGIYKINELLNQDETRKLLRTKYNFVDKDFYDIMANHIFYDYILEKNSHDLQERKADIEYLKAENTRLQKLCTSYELSKSWMITKPFRFISGIVARILRPIKNVKYHYYFGKNKKNMPNIYLMNSEDYGNLGDLQIAVSEIEWMEHCFSQNYRIHEIPATKYTKLLPFVKKYVRKDDLIFINGGGNTGNEYLEAEERRRQIIELFPDNVIYNLPQTVYFNEKKSNYEIELAKSQYIYNQHNNFHFWVRDQYSYEFMKKNFNCDVVLTPDMVLYNDFKQLKRERKNKIIIIFRREFEAKIGQEHRDYISNVAKKYAKSVIEIDNLKEYYSCGKREEEILNHLSEIKEAGLVITDRLHGMIFSVISETPCIVIDNYNQKVSNFYNTWLKDIDYVCLVKNVKQIEKMIPVMLKKKCIYNGEQFKKIFEDLASSIIKNAEVVER